MSEFNKNSYSERSNVNVYGIRVCNDGWIARSYNPFATNGTYACFLYIQFLRIANGQISSTDY